jgi:small subunit ribosomal protein S4e
MGRKGAKERTKREVSPIFWPIHRKEQVWAVHPSPGPHGSNESLPLLVVLRDLLGYAENRREAEVMLTEGKIKVDGRMRTDERFPVGLMDVVEIRDANQYFRVLPSGKGLTLHPISKEEGKFKLCRIESKTTERGGHVQLNLHDGRNLLIKASEPLHPSEEAYKIHDALRIDVSSQDVLDHLIFRDGILALVTGGKSRGQYGQILDIENRPGAFSTAIVRSPNGKEIRTVIDYIFPVGIDSPLISLPGAA